MIVDNELLQDDYLSPAPFMEKAKHAKLHYPHVEV